ncbi:MAG TPA: peptide chain release factor N(5)-glutamine methyltransferase [Geobacteraceae bacterium]|nr:peptide chain release factor N(5)-glutamine methyltransferase [Geobacteraceae bacterium]
MKKQQETWNVLKVLNWTKGYLAEKEVENSRLEAEWMLCAVLAMDRVGLYVNFDKPLSPKELTSFREMVTRRAKREPLQHILGSQEFMALEFDVSPDVLIPRHDTEILVQEAASRCPGAKRILDIGVGSGCVAIALAKVLPQAEVFGVDKSKKALELAERNAERNGVSMTLLNGSLFEPLKGMTFDLIVSNPPYIPSGDIATLQPEVRDFEPREALDGGTDGLDFYRIMIPAAQDHLSLCGWLLFEVGIHQAQQVIRFFENEGCYDNLFTARDTGGIERVVGGQLVSAQPEKRGSN